MPSPSSTARTPGPDRDRREMAARLERGFLATAAEGYQSRAAAADFERCLQLGGTDLRDDELFATLTALVGYYVAVPTCAGLAQVLESLRAGLGQGRQWLRPAIEAWFGAVAWLRGEFDAAAFPARAGHGGPGRGRPARDRRGVVRSRPTRSRRRTSTWP